MTSSNITLSKQPDFILCKSANDRVQNTAVVEENEVTLLPVLCVDVFWRNARSLDLMHHLAHSFQIIDDGAVGEMQLANGRGVDLNGQLAGDGVLPCHGEDLNLVLLDWWELVEWNLETVGFDTQPIGAGLGTAHPDIRVRRIFDLCGADEFLVLGAENVVHCVTGNESGGSQWNIKLLTGAIVVAADLAATSRDLDGEKSGDDWWCETVQGSIDVPAVEAREVEILGFRDDGLVESLMMRVLELDVLKTFIRRNKAVADDLDLRLMWNCLQVWMQNGALRVKSLAVSIASGVRIEALGQFELCSG